jgi:hypothetical protein
MRTLAATLAGLALVIIPSAVAMSGASSSASSAPAGLSPASYQRYLQQTAPSSGHFGTGHHCLKNKGTKQPASGAPNV